MSLSRNIITDLTSDFYHKDNYRRLEVTLVLKENNHAVITAQFHLIIILCCSSKGLVE
jgi:hypothetical protein